MRRANSRCVDPRTAPRAAAAGSHWPKAYLELTSAWLTSACLTRAWLASVAMLLTVPSVGHSWQEVAPPAVDSQAVGLADEPASRPEPDSRDAPAQRSLQPIPAKVVVLTFDDSSRSHFEHVRPLLTQYGFGATFFITEGFDFKQNSRDYMTWDEIAQLHREGFEIGNHTRDHLGITDKTVDQLDEQLTGIEQQCQQHGIPAPITFAWPGNALTVKAFATLRRHGILFARRGGAPEFPYERGRGVAFQPGADHPLLIPSAGDARPLWSLEDFIAAVQQATTGRIAVLQFHGVPDTAHDWVSSSQANFAAYMNYLAVHQYHVLALRDVTRYVDPQHEPADPFAVIRWRQE